MRDAFAKVVEFERRCGHHITPNHPEIPSDHSARMRTRLITEEFAETVLAIQEQDIAEVADGLADLVFVAMGTAVRYGIDLPKVFDAVAEANLLKFGLGSYRSPSGKIMKPPGWVHPDIEAILNSQDVLADSYPPQRLQEAV